MFIEDNIVAMTDSYKFSHWKFLEPGTQKYQSYMECRSNAKFKQTTFFGLQYYIKKYLQGNVVTAEKIRQAEQLVTAHMGPGIFNKKDWELMLARHSGKLPVEIKAVPEGTNVEKSNVLVTIENTDEMFPWLPNYLETLLLKVWYPSTVATLSNYVYRLMLDYAEKTGTPELVPFSLHDFGYRGVSSEESAGLGGMAHLVNFMGSDTTKALVYAANYYDAPLEGTMASISATEHSIVTAPGKDKEVETYGRVLDAVKNGLVANVSDSWDIWNAIKNIYGKALYKKIMERDGTFVVRPDSGDIALDYPKVLDELSNVFPTDINDKGYAVLDSHVSTIWGDGCTVDTIIETMENITEANTERIGWSSDNVHFGMGGGLLQKVDRDTQSFAFKCCAVKVADKWKDVNKTPVDDSTKASKAGRLSHTNTLETVFKDGKLLVEQNFSEIKKRAREEIS